jgi:outer membrane protein TolC
MFSIVSAALALSACAQLGQRTAFEAVKNSTHERIGKEVLWTKSEADRELVSQKTAKLLSQPLTVDDAVQIALLNNKKLQTSFYELGISEANLVAASRLPNPRITLLRANNGDDYKIEQLLTFNIFSLLTLPQAIQIETKRLEKSQKQITAEVLSLAANTRKAYYNAIAAQESVHYMQRVKEAADAGAELANRMVQAGNFNQLQQARERAFYADALLNLQRAQHNDNTNKEILLRLLGISEQSESFKLPTKLPDLPKAANELRLLEQLAIDQRLDVQAAKLHVQATASSLGLSKTTRFFNALEVGPARVLEGSRNDPYKRGYEISLELPLFDFGGAKVAKAESVYMQSVELAAQTALDARSQVRQAYGTYQSSYNIAKHFRDEIVPLKKRISEENQLRYNGMLISVFDLLADARSQVMSVNSYIESLRDFWIADAELDLTLIGPPSSAHLSAAQFVSESRTAH